ncbi:MAG: hypothetical protein MI739_07115 [Bacteroidales bacterium]|nr:hypothetical protein [Bacteroidales bacterium]
MKEKILKTLKPYNYKIVDQEDSILLKNYYGYLKVRCFNDSYEISKKFNFNHYLLLASLIFFCIVVYESRSENSVIIYAIVVVSIIIQIYYNSIMLELRKNKIHSILDKLYN